jgi:hypothetical protein
MAKFSGLVPTEVRRYCRRMYYKRYEYSVVQTTSPIGWKWTVHLDDKQTETGEVSDQQSGVLRSMAVIDRAIQAKLAKPKD